MKTLLLTKLSSFKHHKEWSGARIQPQVYPASLLSRRDTSPTLTTFSGFSCSHCWSRPSKLHDHEDISPGKGLNIVCISNPFGINYYSRSSQLARYFTMNCCLSREKKRPGPSIQEKKKTFCTVTNTVDLQLHELTIKVCYLNHKMISWWWKWRWQ